MIECKACKGSGEVEAHLNYGGSDGEWKVINCPTCRGAGEITTEHAARIEAGKKLRDQRVAAGILLRDAAKAQGLTPAQLSAIENGRAEGGL